VSGSEVASFFLGVAASLLATVLFAAAAAARGRTERSSFHLTFRVAPRLARAGVKDVFASREDYVRHRRPSTATQYMQTAERELIYVGFWLAQAGEIENLKAALRSLLDKGVRITLVLLDENLDAGQREKVAAVLDIDAAALAERLRLAWAELLGFRLDLPAETAARLILKSHEEHIQASAFLFDRDSESAKTLVDLKFYGTGRQASFGLELQPPRHDVDASLYGRATASFGRIADNAVLVDDR
jgi:hypothetical protein